MFQAISPRYTGTDATIPEMQEFMDALNDFTVGKDHPIKITFLKHASKDAELNIKFVYGIEFSPYSEHFQVMGVDDSFNEVYVKLRREHSTSRSISGVYIEVYY